MEHAITGAIGINGEERSFAVGSPNFRHTIKHAAGQSDACLAISAIRAVAKAVQDRKIAPIGLQGEYCSVTVTPTSVGRSIKRAARQNYSALRLSPSTLVSGLP